LAAWLARTASSLPDVRLVGPCPGGKCRWVGNEDQPTDEFTNRISRSGPVSGFRPRGFTLGTIHFRWRRRGRRAHCGSGDRPRRRRCGRRARPGLWRRQAMRRDAITSDRPSGVESGVNRQCRVLLSPHSAVRRCMSGPAGQTSRTKSPSRTRPPGIDPIDLPAGLFRASCTRSAHLRPGDSSRDRRIVQTGSHTYGLGFTFADYPEGRAGSLIHNDFRQSSPHLSTSRMPPPSRSEV